MNMPIDQVRETSNSVHNYLLWAFIGIIKGSRLGHKYVLKKNATNYNVTESKQGSELVKYDAKISDGNETLRIEMKTKLVAPNATMQEVKENALLRTSNLFFKGSKWLLIVAKYSRDMRDVYDRGDFITFLSNCEFIIGCGQGYSHKWSTPKNLNQWGMVLRNAENITSLFNAITNQGTPPPAPPLLLQPRHNSPDDTNQASTNNIDKLVGLYGFNHSQVADILNIPRSQVYRSTALKANYTPMSTKSLYLLVLLDHLHLQTITLEKLRGHVKADEDIRSALRVPLKTLCKYGFITMIKRDGTSVKLSDARINSKHLKDDELFKLSLTTKAFIYAKSSNYKKAKEYVNSLK
jgi:hypothetical protein